MRAPVTPFTTALPFMHLYGPSQAAYAAAFTQAWPGGFAARGLVWFALTSTVGTLAFWLRTRSYHRPQPSPPSPLERPHGGPPCGRATVARHGTAR
ncbi:hypothetical protein ACFWJT_13895 [Streptomyces sp. NPDC127069]|uniref:hypothetical protein n=1 Tax=Streptomyces sp. NPDC127069 TaxID=3347128 RepID=UPI00364EA7F6